MFAALAASAVLTLSVTPTVAVRDGQVRIAVSGIRAPAASIHLQGGIASGGRWFGWVPLRDDGEGSWFTVLRAPGYLGVYPVVVRSGGILQGTGAVVTVLPPGWTRQPVFDRPEYVPQWWTRMAPAGAILTSVYTWHTGFFTHRDPSLNLLLRARFTLLGDWPAKHLRKGPHVLFFSIARLKPSGGWRLLETTTAP